MWWCRRTSIGTFWHRHDTEASVPHHITFPLKWSPELHLNLNILSRSRSSCGGWEMEKESGQLLSTDGGKDSGLPERDRPRVSVSGMQPGRPDLWRHGKSSAPKYFIKKEYPSESLLLSYLIGFRGITWICTCKTSLIQNHMRSNIFLRLVRTVWDVELWAVDRGPEETRPGQTVLPAGNCWFHSSTNCLSLGHIKVGSFQPQKTPEFICDPSKTPSSKGSRCGPFGLLPSSIAPFRSALTICTKNQTTNQSPFQPDKVTQVWNLDWDRLNRRVYFSPLPSVLWSESRAEHLHDFIVAQHLLIVGAVRSKFSSAPDASWNQTVTAFCLYYSGRQ